MIYAELGCYSPQEQNFLIKIYRAFSSQFCLLSQPNPSYKLHPLLKPRNREEEAF